MVLFAVYILALCYFMFFAEMFGRTEIGKEYHYNLVLFREIKRFWAYREVLGKMAVWTNLVGNVVGFSPYGFYLPVFFQKVQNWRAVTLLSFLLSLSIETIQLVFKVGSFDVDDLLLNTLGGLLGYLIYWIVKKAGGKFHERA